MLGFASSAHAVYVDAKGGSGGNTVNASTGSTTEMFTYFILNSPPYFK
jgi:hypothetical protein